MLDAGLCSTAHQVRRLGVATYVRTALRSRTGSTDNHATSGLKFAVLRNFVVAGCSVLLSDVDVVWLQNPFTLPSLYRDVDVEVSSIYHCNRFHSWLQPPSPMVATSITHGCSLYHTWSQGMTDGWDDPSAFGYTWKDGRGHEQLRLSARNSGLFFIAATEEVLRMMSRLKRRMETEGVWDQTAYNEEMWYAALAAPRSLAAYHPARD